MEIIRLSRYFYNLDVFFLARQKFRDHGRLLDGIMNCDTQSTQISLNVSASTNQSFHASDKQDGVQTNVAWIGYIVRLSDGGKPIKIIASDKALEKLA
ncbi:MAG: hypothetical protein Q8N81_07890, partial [bacterium]|nr:hypothetical protein [bacterium]